MQINTILYDVLHHMILNIVVYFELYYTFEYLKRRNNFNKIDCNIFYSYN